MRDANKKFLKSLSGDDLQKSIPCIHGSTVTSGYHERQPVWMGATEHEPRDATHILENGGRQFPLCSQCVRLAGKSGHGTISPIKYTNPDRKLHSDVAINAASLKSSRQIKQVLAEHKQYQDGRHTGGNGPMEKSFTPGAPRCSWGHHAGVCGSDMEHVSISNPAVGYCSHHLAMGKRFGLVEESHYKPVTTQSKNTEQADQVLHQRPKDAVATNTDVSQAKKRGLKFSAPNQPTGALGLTKSLGSQQFEQDLLAKSPRRRETKHLSPPEGMPEEMHSSWHAFGVVPQSVMARWKSPEHEMHHAYLAKEWTRQNTNQKLYGAGNVHQFSEGWKATPQGQAFFSPEATKKREGKRAQTIGAKVKIREDFHAHMKKIEGVASTRQVSPETAKLRSGYVKEKAGKDHLTYEGGHHLITALGDYQRAGKMSDKEITRSANFKENFHDSADAHAEKHGSYEGYKHSLVHLHPHMAELAHRAMQSFSNSNHAETKQIVRHSNDAIEQFKDHPHG